MPTYEYTCDKCGHDFELFRSMTAPPMKQCPKELCPKKVWGKGKVTKKMSAGAGLLFKGDGFYITDYRSDKYKASAKKEAGETKSAPKAEAKAESKPAAKVNKR